MLYGKRSSKFRKRREELRQLVDKIKFSHEPGYSVETLSREVFPKTQLDLVEAMLGTQPGWDFLDSENYFNNLEIAQRLLLEYPDSMFCKNLRLCETSAAQKVGTKETSLS